MPLVSFLGEDGTVEEDPYIRLIWVILSYTFGRNMLGFIFHSHYSISVIIKVNDYLDTGRHLFVFIKDFVDR